MGANLYYEVMLFFPLSKHCFVAVRLRRGPSSAIPTVHRVWTAYCIDLSRFIISRLSCMRPGIVRAGLLRDPTQRTIKCEGKHEEWSCPNPRGHWLYFSGTRTGRCLVSRAPRVQNCTSLIECERGIMYFIYSSAFLDEKSSRSFYNQVKSVFLFFFFFFSFSHSNVLLGGRSCSFGGIRSFHLALSAFILNPSLPCFWLSLHFWPCQNCFLLL